MSGVRLISRRRPAGSEREPPERLTPEVVDRIRRPFVLRLAPGGALLDLPAGRPMRRVVSFWPDRAQVGGWVEVDWPIDARHGWFIAPLDLRVGHLVEFQPADSAVPMTCWVAAADPARMVMAPARDRIDACDTAARWEAGVGWVP